jgi:hypothetical protein
MLQELLTLEQTQLVLALIPKTQKKENQIQKRQISPNLQTKRRPRPINQKNTFKMATKNQPNSIQIASLNVNGLVTPGKAAPLFRYLLSSKIDVFLIQETHIYNEGTKEKIAKLWMGDS